MAILDQETVRLWGPPEALQSFGLVSERGFD